MAKQIAIRKGYKFFNVFNGALKLVLWEPNDGVIFLKNKKIFKIYPENSSSLLDQGGSMWISPFKGEELKAHFPLKDKVLIWESSDVLTREGIEIFVKLNIFWQVSSIEKFIYKIGQKIRIEDDSYNTTLNVAAEERIKVITESNIRDVLSSSSVVTLNPTNVANYLTKINSNDKNNINFIEVQTGKQGELSEKLKGMINEEIEGYGLEVEKIKIEKTSLPDQIQQSLNTIYQKALQPIATQLDAQSKSIETDLIYSENKAIHKAKLAAYKEELGVEAATKLMILEKAQDIEFDKSDKLKDILKTVNVNVGIEDKSNKST